MPDDKPARAGKNLQRAAEDLKALIERNNEQIRKNQELLDKINAERKRRGIGPTGPLPSTSS